ncbi:MAG: helix-turn-helix transcriptional regulator [Eubacterium sp.]|nr:helix-turn-helix transcriptional regulator [Eubacterium sp.]
MNSTFSYKTFSDNLKLYMHINNITQTDLINDLDFDKSAVSTWVNGTRLPRIEKIITLSEYFGIPVHEFFISNEDKDSNALSNLRKDEQELISTYRKLDYHKREHLNHLVMYFLLLNDIGIEKATERTEELTQIQTYKNI